MKCDECHEENDYFDMTECSCDSLVCEGCYNEKHRDHDNDEDGMDI